MLVECPKCGEVFETEDDEILPTDLVTDAYRAQVREQWLSGQGFGF